MVCTLATSVKSYVYYAFLYSKFKVIFWFLFSESKSLELSTKLLQLLVNKLNVDMLNTEIIQGVATMVRVVQNSE